MQSCGFDAVAAKPDAVLMLWQQNQMRWALEPDAVNSAELWIERNGK
jgi:hypothetical protein